MRLLIFSLLSILETVRHWYVIEKLKVSPNKLLSFIGRFLVGFVFFWYDDSNVPLQVKALAYLIVDWYIHDYLLNVLRGVKPIWYLNSTGLIDRFQNEVPNAFVWFVWKTMLFVSSILMYYVNTY